MRFATLLPLALLPVVFSQGTLNARTFSNLDARHNVCKNDPTRDVDTCACLFGFDTPAKQSQRCYCPDEANTLLEVNLETKLDDVLGVDVKVEVAICVCRGGAQSEWTH